MATKVLGQSSLCLVTGASQGIGREIALGLGKRLGPGSTILLLARSHDGLEATKALISSQASHLNIETLTCDLSKTTLEEMKKMLSKYNEKKYDVYFLVHNAGSEGSGMKCLQQPEEGYWAQYLSLNLTSMVHLSVAWFSELKIDSGLKLVINITSKAAVEPFPSLGEYCVTKAAREMWLKVLAKEDPSILVLNYSPGPVRTEMIDRVISKVVDNDVKGAFEKMRDEGGLVETKDTVCRLISILDDPTFTSGSRIDYFD